MPVRRGSLVVSLTVLLSLLVLGHQSYADAVDTPLKTAGDQASAALERVTQSKASYDQATAKAQEVRLQLDTNRNRLAELEEQVDTTRDRMRGYVVGMFRGEGAGLGQIEQLLAAEDAKEFLDAARLLDAATSRQGEVMESLSAQQTRATKIAAESEQLVEDLAALEKTAKDSLADAEAAKREADILVQRAQREVATRDSARQAASGASRAPRPVPVFTPAAGECGGGSVAGYPNGRIPTSLLCPLWGAGGGESLRADAAAAFNLMSQSYAETYGGPICVTDSYRSYDEQVSVKRSRGSFAARPGTSNHGWGLAVDLCGGINTFGSSPHNWMRNNAPAFGFFHPGWAQRGGSKPEAWHWEFAG